MTGDGIIFVARLDFQATRRTWRCGDVGFDWILSFLFSFRFDFQSRDSPFQRTASKVRWASRQATWRFISLSRSQQLTGLQWESMNTGWDAHQGTVIIEGFYRHQCCFCCDISGGEWWCTGHTHGVYT